MRRHCRPCRGQARRVHPLTRRPGGLNTLRGPFRGRQPVGGARGTPLARIRPYRVGVEPSPQFSRAGNLPAKANVIAGYGRHVFDKTTLAKTVLTLLNFL